MARKRKTRGNAYIEHFTARFDPQKLTLTDLMEARDAYHAQLANLPNVVGTALGRYRIRHRDNDEKRRREGWTRYPRAPERTLANSSVKSWSWPCVLVFVSKWRTRDEQGETYDEMVPNWLHLPGGIKKIPTCVIYAPRQLRPDYSPTTLAFPSGLHGGGYPVLTVEQGQERVASLGCLVSDGQAVYGLTNRHVLGATGAPVYTVERGELRQLGTSVELSARTVPLEQVYPGWAGSRTHLNIDAGLFRIDDLSLWTSQVYGVGRLAEPIDLNVDTLSLDIIGCPVKAFGAMSGALRGSIEGLLYRYRSIGGHDYLADLLIGPRAGEALVDTHPGDSGTLWVFDEEVAAPVVAPEDSAKAERDKRARAPECRPLALQWGGHSFRSPDGPDSRFVLATSLSNVCRLLDVDLVRDWNIEHSQYWGKVGHYKIAYSACFLTKSSKLRKLLEANAENIAVSDEDIENGDMPKAGKGTFVALADVPDLVWRSSRGLDKANHFADMDEEAPSGPFKGKSLMSMWNTAANRTPQVWTQFYDNMDPPPKDQHRGALPFRVGQMFNEMVEHLKAGALDKFVCVAGTMAHYVGDACQPLHVSHLHHGADESESSVHEVYETRMLDRFAAEFISALNTRLEGEKATGSIVTGAQAADLTVKLMKATLKKLPPERILEVFRQSRGQSQTAAMWTELGKDTVAVTAMGALALADLWESAWQAAAAQSKFTVAACGKAINKNRLRSLYEDKSIAKSAWLKDMKSP